MTETLKRPLLCCQVLQYFVLCELECVFIFWYEKYCVVSIMQCETVQYFFLMHIICVFFFNQIAGCNLNVERSCFVHHWSRVSIFYSSLLLCVQIIAKKCGLSWEELSSLADLQLAVRGSLDEMIALVKEFLHKEPYSKEEVR